MASLYSRVSEEIKKLDLNNPNIKIDIEEVMQDVAKELKISVEILDKIKDLNVEEFKEFINKFAGEYSIINDKENFSE